VSDHRWRLGAWRGRRALARRTGCDVTREDDGKAAVAAAQTLGTLRGLINCAGIAIGSKTVGRDGPHPLDAFSRVIQINLIGTFN
ncbi:SDR family NAD(P)-dependent oxidoreductase, partial [Klebsiella pneumoniae]|uniref:SDR family NAD(P)-dependent oxidoreductase n=1 Tax=Klebsiella pneumoniae TaxID=573 RepID=UPI003B5BEDA8